MSSTFKNGVVLFNPTYIPVNFILFY